MDFGLVYVVIGGLIIMFWFLYMGVYRSESHMRDPWYLRMLWFMLFWFIGSFVLEAIIG